MMFSGYLLEYVAERIAEASAIAGALIHVTSMYM